MLRRDVTHIGIAAAYAPRSKYKVFWALILASPDDREVAVSMSKRSQLESERGLTRAIAL